VVVQVALAFVLVVGAGLLLYSLGRLRDVPLGIRAQDVLAFELHLPDARYDSTARASFYEAFARRAEQLPGVRAAGGISKLPATGNYHTWGTRAVTGPYVGDRRHRGAFDQRVIAGDYFRAVGIPLLAGRVFDDRDVPDAPQRVIVSASAAKTLFGAANPIGQRLNAGGREAEVIGVVGDAAVNNEGRVVPYVYHAHRQFAGDRNWALAQVVATNDPNSTVGPIRALLASLGGRLVLFRPAPLDEVIGRGASERLFTMRLLRDDPAPGTDAHGDRTRSRSVWRGRIVSRGRVAALPGASDGRDGARRRVCRDGARQRHCGVCAGASRDEHRSARRAVLAG
jgi:hypothetical protein